MAHSYKASYPPSLSVDPGIVAFFEKFYEVSDTPSAHDVYADSFTPDAIFQAGIKQVKGQDEILATRKGMWDAVASRKHTVYKVFPFGENATELMLYGNVLYGFKDGREKTVDWAARAEMVEHGGKWRFKAYQIYLVGGNGKYIRIRWVLTGRLGFCGNEGLIRIAHFVSGLRMTDT